MTEATPGKLQLALVQMNSGSDEAATNVGKAVELVNQAAAQGARLVVLPEFFNVPYFAQYWDYHYMDLAESQDGPSMSRVRDAARENDVYLVATIFEEAAPGVYFDTAFLVSPDGDLVGAYRKTHPAAVKSLEKIFFKAGSSFPVWTVDGVRVSAIICYDHYFPETARCAALAGAELIVGPFAAPLETTGMWTAMMTVRAFENGVYMAPCNKVGREGDWTFRGRSMVVDPHGRCLADAGEESEIIVMAEVARSEVVKARTAFPMFRDRRPDLYTNICTPEDQILSRP